MPTKPRQRYQFTPYTMTFAEGEYRQAVINTDPMPISKIRSRPYTTIPSPVRPLPGIWAGWSIGQWALTQDQRPKPVDRWRHTTRHRALLQQSQRASR